MLSPKPLAVMLFALIQDFDSTFQKHHAKQIELQSLLDSSKSPELLDVTRKLKEKLVVDHRKAINTFTDVIIEVMRAVNS
jgi:hypothetical protein